MRWRSWFGNFSRTHPRPRAIEYGTISAAVSIVVATAALLAGEHLRFALTEVQSIFGATVVVTR